MPTSPAYRLTRLHSRVLGLLRKSSVHGADRVVGSAQADKFIWLSVLSFTFLGMSVHSVNQIALYLSHPISSTVRLSPNSFQMPDVTICDPMQTKFFLYRNIGDYEKKAGSGGRGHFQYTKFLQYMLGYYFGYEDDNYLRATYAGLEHRVNMSAVSARLFDFVIACRYNGRECRQGDFVTYYHRIFGNCFTYRPPSRSLRSENADDGLVLVLYSPSTDANFPLDRFAMSVTGLESKGFRVVIHEGGTRPKPLLSELFVQTGHRTDLPLTQTSTSIISTPSKPCTPPATRVYYDSMLKASTIYLSELADCLELERSRRILTAADCVMEGPVPSTGGRLPPFCHDVFGVQGQPEDRVRALLRSLDAVEKRHKAERGNLTAFFRSFALDVRRQFPEILAGLRRLVAAVNATRLAEPAETQCSNMCSSTSYEYFVIQSVWPEHSLGARGADIQLGKVSRILSDHLARHAGAIPPAAIAKSLNASGLEPERCVVLEKAASPRPDNSKAAGAARDPCKPLQRFISSHTAQLRIFAKTHTIRVMTEENSYTLISLLSDMGGIIGLWIGASCITVFEVGEIFSLAASFYFFKLLHTVRELRQRRRPPLRRAREPDDDSIVVLGSGVAQKTGGGGGGGGGSGGGNNNGFAIGDAADTAIAGLVATNSREDLAREARRPLLAPLCSLCHLDSRGASVDLQLDELEDLITVRRGSAAAGDVV